MNFIFPYIGNFIIPTDELIFFRGIFMVQSMKDDLENCKLWPLWNQKHHPAYHLIPKVWPISLTVSEWIQVNLKICPCFFSQLQNRYVEKWEIWNLYEFMTFTCNETSKNCPVIQYVLGNLYNPEFLKKHTYFGKFYASRFFWESFVLGISEIPGWQGCLKERKSVHAGVRT